MTRRKSDHPIPEKPEPPFPIVTDFCDIVCGFGRGSAELGIPTANVPIEQLPKSVNDLKLGVYFGYAKIKPVEHEVGTVTRSDGRDVRIDYGRDLKKDSGDLSILPVVLSVGKNPFYGNDFKTVELHIIHNFKDDFYGAKVKFNILGYIRPELDYTTKEALIEDIHIDITTALKALESRDFSVYQSQLKDQELSSR